MYKYEITVAFLVIFSSVGCRQTTNPTMQQMMPINPLAPLAPQTRVAPPPTGSYSVPGGYYQGQASNQAVNNSAGQVAQSAPRVGSGLAVTNLQPTAAEAPPNMTFPTNAATTTSVASTSPSTLPAWTDQSPRYSGDVQPAAYVTPAGSLQPQLRGMQVSQLSTTASSNPSTTSASNLKPAGKPDSATLPWRKPLDR
jgi:hypothetical protein